MAKQLSFIDLFAGIGGTRIAFEGLGCKCVFSSEWDKHAQKTYEANFGEVPSGDITKIKPSEIPDHDILLAGFPCQPFSIIGNGKGFADTRRQAGNALPIPMIREVGRNMLEAVQRKAILEPIKKQIQKNISGEAVDEKQGLPCSCIP